MFPVLQKVCYTNLVYCKAEFIHLVHHVFVFSVNGFKHSAFHVWTEFIE